MLEEVFKEAISDKFALASKSSNSESRCLYGVKITRYSDGAIVLVNVATESEEHVPLTDSQLSHFCNGWRFGVYKLAIVNSRASLSKIKKSLANANPNGKRFKALMSSKKELEAFILKIKIKLNHEQHI